MDSPREITNTIYEIILKGRGTGRDRRISVENEIERALEAERSRIIGILSGLGNHDSFETIKQKIMGEQ